MNPNSVTLPPRTARSPRWGAVAIACALLLSGCGVRFDSPPPTEPVPNPVEVVRRTAVDDALHVAEQAEYVAGLDGTKPALAETLLGIATTSRQHAGQLGGKYDSGLETSPPTPTPSDLPEIPPDPADVLATLTDASARSATAADICEDGPLARLIASISAAQTLAARDLAAATGAQVPAYTAPDIPGSQETPPAAPSATPSATGDPGTTAQVVPSARSTVPPGGLDQDDLVALVLAEDSAAYAFEVQAARSDREKDRERLAERARTHRERAEGWARLAGVDGTDKDPRRTAYETAGTETSSKDLVQEAENKLAADYGNIVGLADPGTRATAVALLTDSVITESSWGVPASPFPGLPEQAS